MLDRKPTPAERQGIDWWNGLTDDERRYWLLLANRARPAPGTASVADAWATFQAVRRSMH